MKVLFAYDYPESGTESVLKEVACGLREQGHEIDLLYTEGGREAGSAAKDLSLLSYDVAHFWNIRAVLPFKETIGIPFGVTIHGFVRGAEDGYFGSLQELEPDWIHCMDSFTQHRLGQQRLFATRTAQIIDIEGFTPLAAPENFTMGFTGDMKDFDGFDILTEIGVRTNIPMHGHDASLEWIPRDQMSDRFFSKISVFVSWAFGACGPVTAQEALLCGRPVLATPTETMVQVLRPGWNGEFFDGSVEDGIRQLRKIQENYQSYAENARRTTLNDPDPVIQTFIDKWKEIL